MTLRIQNLGGWRLLFLALLAGGVIASPMQQEIARMRVLPWGMAFGLATACGSALATGGLVIAAFLYAVRSERGMPLLRPSLLAAMMGHIVAMLGALADMSGRAAWQALSLWNPRFFLAGSFWTMVLYAAVLVLEFGEKPRWPAGLQWACHLQLPLAATAAVLAILHQWAVTWPLLQGQARLASLWVAPMLPVLSVAVAVAACLAVVILVSERRRVAGGSRLPEATVQLASRALGLSLLAYLGLRASDLQAMPSSAFPLPAKDVALFVLEAASVLTALLCLVPPPYPGPKRHLYLGAAAALAWVIVNRLNLTIVALESALRVSYLPHWSEVLLTYSLVAVGVAGFGLGAARLPVFTLDLGKGETTWSHSYAK